ncbi:MAG: STAS domain-containing protein [Lentisphaeria bacterium]|nr:STAS domain-containing protein [Lentisphaeria bacterium]
MEITTAAGYQVARMPERLDTLNAADVELELNALLEKGTTQLACDFSGTRYVASAGLRVMLIMYKKLKAAQGSLVLFKLNKEVFDVFKLSGFARLMDIRETL